MNDLDDLDFDPEFDGEGLHEHIESGDDCGPPVHRDCVDDCLESLIEMLERNDYDAEVADQAVYQAMESLMLQESITDTPDIDQPEASKHAWIANARSQIVDRLREMGLEFSED